MHVCKCIFSNQKPLLTLPSLGLRKLDEENVFSRAVYLTHTQADSSTPTHTYQHTCPGKRPLFDVEEIFTAVWEMLWLGTSVAQCPDTWSRLWRRDHNPAHGQGPYER